MAHNWAVSNTMSIATVLSGLLLMLGVMSLPGCATWSQHGVSVSDQAPLQIAAMPIATTVTVSQLSDIKTIAMSPEDGDETAVIQQELSRAANQLDHQLAVELTTQASIAVLSPAPLADTASTFGVLWEGGAQSMPLLQQLPATTQAVLLVRLAGYGKIKGEWQTYLIGTGVAEGVIQGVLVAQAVSTPWAGVAVAAEEIAQEVLLWGGGARLFNSYYAPERGRKELQLEATAAKAVGELAASLRAAMANEARDVSTNHAQLTQVDVGE